MKLSYDEILKLQVNEEYGTIEKYLMTLLLTLLNEKEEFSGKRPFGDSDWDYDLYKPLVIAKVVKGVVDDDGYVSISLNERIKADKLINKLVTYIFEG